MVDVLPMREKMNIKTEGGVSLVGKESASLHTSGWVPVFRVEDEGAGGDGFKKTGNSAKIFETVRKQTRRIKTEVVEVDLTESPSPEECVLSYASSSCAAESNILTKEEDIDADDGEFQGILESNYQPSEDEERSKCDEEPSQPISYEQENESTLWGLCEEDSDPLSTVTEDQHTIESEGSGANDSFDFARVPSILKDLMSRPITDIVEKRIQCPHCPARFFQNTHLKSHLAIHTEEKPFACTLCPSRFVARSTLKRHQLVHTKERPFACTFCDAKFSLNSTLKSHLTIHTGEKHYSCPFCPAKFSQSSNLSTHVRLHTNERPYTCTYCPARFMRKDDLKSHLIIHTGEKKYACEHCPAKFSRSSHFRTHQRIHTKEKPFLCPHCPGRYAQSGTLKRHIVMHTGEKPFACPLCSAKFGRKSYLNCHLKKHTAQKDLQNCSS